MLALPLFVAAITAMAVSFVSRERLFWLADRDPVAADILENSHITNDLWIRFYRKRNLIDSQLRRLITVYFWSSLATAVFMLFAFVAYWLAA